MSDTPDETDSESPELDAVVSLVRRLMVAARMDMAHGPNRPGGHSPRNCDSCAAVAEGYAFLAAMTNKGDSLATGDPAIGQPARRLVSVP